MNLNVDLKRVRSEVEKIVGTGNQVMLLGEIPFTPRAKKVLEYSVEEASQLDHRYVGTEHLLLGLLKEEEGVAARVLENLGLRLDTVREEVLNLLNGLKSPAPKVVPPILPGTLELRQVEALECIAESLRALAKKLA